MMRPRALLDHPELLAWERQRFNFFQSEVATRRPKEIIDLLDKLFPPPPVWYDLRPNREAQGDGFRQHRVGEAPETHESGGSSPSA